MTNPSESRLKGYVRRLLRSRVPELWLQIPAAEEVVEGFVMALSSAAFSRRRPALAPSRYTVVLPPSVAARVKQQRTWWEELAMTVHRAGRDLGLQFAVLPLVGVRAEPRVSENAARLEYVFWEPEHLRAVPLDPRLNTPPGGAYLVLSETKSYALERGHVHIGRRPDNDLVIDDPRVSRLHAQLRAYQGRYMLFDLGSTGGTFVNGQRITATALYPGDTITLAEVTLTYGQRSTRPLPSLPDVITQPLPGRLQRTVVLPKNHQHDGDTPPPKEGPS